MTTLLVHLLTTSALAQAPGDFGVPLKVLAPADLLNAWGDGTTVGSPAVASHTVAGNGNPPVLMLYETRITAASTACPAGTWGIGLAYRFGGGDFTDTGPVVTPDQDCYTCVAAHPSIVALDTDTWLIYFKAEQDPDTCNPKAQWGCDRYPGIGRFILQYNGRNGNVLNYSVTSVDTTPVLTQVAQNMGYPSVMFADGEFHMAYGQFPDIYLTSSTLSGAYNTPAYPSLTSGTSATGWEEDELYTPSLLCRTNADFALYAGGRIYDSTGTIVDQGIGRFDSTDLSNWTEDANGPLLHSSNGDPALRHATMVSSGGHTGFGLFYTETNTSGINEMWLATTPLWDRKDIDVQRCP